MDATSPRAHSNASPSLQGGGECRITAVIPTFNRGGLVTRALESVLGQSRPPDEIVVVDDGSTDNTRERLREYAKAVEYIYQENAGGAAARNRGVAAAHHEWIAFLDSDDVWSPDHLEQMVRAIVSTRGEAACYFSDLASSQGSKHSSRWKITAFAPRQPFELVADGTDWVMIEYQPMMLQASVFKKSVLQEVGGLWEDLRTAHDTHFYLKIGIGRPLCAVAGCGARQTSDDQDSSRLTTRHGSVRTGRLKNRVLLYQDILDRFPSLDARHRRTLRTRISSAEWALARIALKEGKFLRSGRSAARAIAASLAHIARRSMASSRRTL